MECLGRKIPLKQDTPDPRPAIWVQLLTLLLYLRSPEYTDDMRSLSRKRVPIEVLSFHGVFGIPTPKDIPGHHPEFAKAAATEESHQEAIVCAKAMAMLGWRVLQKKGWPNAPGKTLTRR